MPGASSHSECATQLTVYLSNSKPYGWYSFLHIGNVRILVSFMAELEESAVFNREVTNLSQQ